MGNQLATTAWLMLRPVGENDIKTMHNNIAWTNAN